MDVVASSGRDRAGKVSAVAATIAHGVDRLPAHELERLSEALEDHTRSYLEWLSELNASSAPFVPGLRGILTTILHANALLRSSTDAVVRRRLADMLGRSASNLVAAVDAAGLAADG